MKETIGRTVDIISGLVIKVGQIGQKFDELLTYGQFEQLSGRLDLMQQLFSQNVVNNENRIYLFGYDVNTSNTYSELVIYNDSANKAFIIRSYRQMQMFENIKYNIDTGFTSQSGNEIENFDINSIDLGNGVIIHINDETPSSSSGKPFLPFKFIIENVSFQILSDNAKYYFIYQSGKDYTIAIRYLSSTSPY